MESETVSKRENTVPRNRNRIIMVRMQFAQERKVQTRHEQRATPTMFRLWRQSRV